jgi:predicted transport protein
MNENVVNQGLFYLDWLMDHKGDFQVLVMDRLGADVAQTIEWSGPRLLCIAGDFTKYDEHAVQQINRNIELIRYRRYGDELLLLELVNAASGPPEEHSSSLVASPAPRREDPTFTDLLGKCSTELNDRFEALQAFTMALGDDVQMKTLKYYVAFKRIRNFVCAEVHPQIGTLVLWLKIDPDQVELESGFTRDMREIGHYGTGDLEITIRTDQDFEKAQPLILQSYEGV